MQRQSAEPDVISYSSAISACVKGAQPEQALQLREIQRRSVEPNVISYNAAISACQMGVYSEQARQLLRKMQRQSVEPDVISCSSTISACARGAQPKRALQLREIQRRSAEPKVISYNAAISACQMMTLPQADSTTLSRPPTSGRPTDRPPGGAQRRGPAPREGRVPPRPASRRDCAPDRRVAGRGAGAARNRGAWECPRSDEWVDVALVEAETLTVLPGS